jgi:hypothetical protein
MIIDITLYCRAIRSLTNADFSLEETTITWITQPNPPVSQQQIDEAYAKAVAYIPYNNCKQQASELLYATDWTTIPDVADPANSPYLTNQAEFITWRSQIRALAINPVVDPIFPAKPNEIWG